MNNSRLTQTQKEIILIYGRLHQFVLDNNLDKKANIDLSNNSHLELLDSTGRKKIKPHLTKHGAKQLEVIASDIEKFIINTLNKQNESATTNSKTAEFTLTT